VNTSHPKPTFLLAGAARSGSTALYNWLDSNLQVFMCPIKETNYFANLRRDMQGPGDAVLNMSLERREDGSFESRGSAIVKSWAIYLDLFLNSEEFSARGEASPSYLYYPKTAQNIRERLPNCKLVFILRNPVDRAFSAYKVLRWWGRESRDFETALYLEEKRLQAGWEHIWAYKGMGLYASQIERYLDAFPRKQLGIWLFDQLQNDPEGLYSEVCSFIGVDNVYPVDFSQRNQSYGKIGWMKRFWDKFPQTKGLRRKLIPAIVREKVKSLDRLVFGRDLVFRPSTRDFLLDYFHDDVLRLQALLPELDFGSWLRD
jgi:hypothetical protein